jgi:hypothetical protein
MWLMHGLERWRPSALAVDEHHLRLGAKQMEALPLGLKLSKLYRFGKLPVQFSGLYEYNLQDGLVAPNRGCRLSNTPCAMFLRQRIPCGLFSLA